LEEALKVQASSEKVDDKSSKGTVRNKSNHRF
jgi:hypothetical protein